MFNIKFSFFSIISILFFLSGLTALVYQIIWMRQLSLFFGSDVYATTITLGTFMAGLSLGSYISGLIGDNLKKPILIYGILEIFIALSAALFPLIIFGMDETFRIVYQNYFFDQPLKYQLFRLLISIFTLLIPTIFMGATLPLLIRQFAIKKIELGEKVGFFYSINTFGALTGTILAGFILIQIAGITYSTIIMVITNIVVGIIAIIFSFNSFEKKDNFFPKQSQKRNILDEEKIHKFDPKYILFSTFFTGMAALALEVVWTRILVKSFSGTTHSFSIMLACFLFGIFYGSKKISKKLSNNHYPILILFKLQLWLAATVALLAPLTYLAPNIFGNLTWTLTSLMDGNFAIASILAQFIVASLLILIPTTLLGASFPAAVKSYINNFDFRARGTGYIYAFNTFGAVIGSLIGGFVLLPIFGTRISLIIIAALFFFSALILRKLIIRIENYDSIIKFHKFLPVIIFMASSIAISIMPDKTIMNYNMQKNSRPNVIYHSDGISHTIDIVKSDEDNIIMLINGNIEADTSYVQRRQFVLIAHLPMLLHGEANNVATVGLGLGITLKSLLNNPLVKNLKLIEISPEMIEAHKLNPEISGNALSNSKLEIVIDDARNYINMSNQKFDVITASLNHPRITGAGSLFAKEYYEILKDKLNTNGIVLQWMPMYQVSKKSFDVALKTFTEVYPNYSFWYVKGHGLFVGSLKPINLDFNDFAERYNQIPIKKDLLSIGIKTPEELLGHMLMDKANIISYLNSGEKIIINTDDNAYLEFHTPFEFLEKTESIVSELLPRVGWKIGSILKSYSSAEENKIKKSFDYRVNKLISELKEKIQ